MKFSLSENNNAVQALRLELEAERARYAALVAGQKQAETENKRQVGTFNSLLDSIPDIIFFKDTNGVYLGCNPAFSEVAGRPRAAIVGMTDFDLFAPDFAALFRAHDQLMLEQLEPRHNEEWITYPDGRKILIDTLKTPFWGPDGTLIGILGISRDITQRKKAEQALSESEANFRTFFESLDDLIVVATPEGRILFTNQALERKLGYTTGELTALHVLDLHHADSRQEATDIFTAMIRGERQSCPLPLVAKTGALLPVETRTWAGKWNGADCLFGISKDLTAEQEAKQRFERLFRNNPSPMALTRLPDRTFEDVNHAFLNALGYAREDIVGKTSEALRLFVNSDVQATVAARLQVTGHVNDFELQVRRKDGTILDGLFSGEVISNHGQRYMLTVMTDITERKRIAWELARLSVIQHELMHLATHFVNVPLGGQDEAINQSLATMGRLIQADRAYLFAYDFEKDIMSNTHEWCAAGITPEIENLKVVPNALVPDWVESHKLGKSVHIPSVAALPEASNLRQVLEPQGIRSLITLPLTQGASCLGFVGFDAVREERIWGNEEVALLRVLAELYAHFESRPAADRETRELQNRLIQARDAAQEAARAKSLFLANMSHEIRTPLNAILGYAQIMERECRPCAAKQRLTAISRSGEHLLELITDLMELVRSDAGKTTLLPVDFDLQKVLEDVSLMFFRRAEAQGVTLEHTYPPDAPRLISADKGKVRQILLNLIENALKFTEQGSVRMAASVKPGAAPDTLAITVDVSDTGCGIRVEEQASIFEIFEQGENSLKIGKGTGLGLPLSRRYAQALGGDVTVTSTPGAGSCFRFEFTARAVRAGTAPGHPGSVLRLAPDERVYRILVVDDVPSNREMLAVMLTAVGFAVETADSGVEALRRLRQSGGIDMVMMDKQMPEMDGFEAIRQIRGLPRGHQLAVLVVTASGFTELREQALAAGADGHVSKPVRREQLLEEIRRVAGLRFDYEETRTPPAPEKAVVDPAALARLPADQLHLLSQALHRGDSRQLRRLVDDLGPDLADLAAGLRALIDAYAYDRLRRLFEAAKGRTP